MALSVAGALSQQLRNIAELVDSRPAYINDDTYEKAIRQAEALEKLLLPPVDCTEVVQNNGDNEHDAPVRLSPQTPPPLSPKGQKNGDEAEERELPVQGKGPNSAKKAARRTATPAKTSAPVMYRSNAIQSHHS